MAVLRSGNHHAHSTDEEAEAREGNPRRREPGWGCCSSDMEACCCSSQKPGWARTGQNPATIPSSHRPDTKGDHRLHLHVVKSCLYPWAHIIFLLSQEVLPLSPVSCASLNTLSLFAGKVAPNPRETDSHKDPSGTVSIS